MKSRVVEIADIVSLILYHCNSLAMKSLGEKLTSRNHCLINLLALPDLFVETSLPNQGQS